MFNGLAENTGVWHRHRYRYNMDNKNNMARMFCTWPLVSVRCLLWMHAGCVPPPPGLGLSARYILSRSASVRLPVLTHVEYMGETWRLKSAKSAPESRLVPVP